MRTIALARCPTCAGERREDAGLGLVRCAACGTVYAPEYADPDDVFRDGYLSGGTGAFGIDLSHPRFHAYLVDAGHTRCRFVERHVPGRGAWLDVGCGSGELLEAAAARGWRAVGVEPLPDASALARDRGLDVRTALLEESGLPQSEWEVVSAFHVLEHMPDAPAFLSLLARWARPGGLVVVESPNWAAIARGRYGRRWMHLRPLEHLVHWAPATLREAFARAGLEPVEVATPSYLHRMHTLDEALQLIGRPQWRGRLRALAREREVEGAQALVPTAAGRALLRAAARVQDRAGRGAVVLGAARRPAP